MRKSAFWLCLGGLVVLLGGAWRASLAQPPAPATGEGLPQFTYAEHYIFPVRIHLLKSETLPWVQCKLTLTDMQRVFGKMNRIWNQAGVELYLESVSVEEAAGQTLYAPDFLPPMLHGYLALRPAASKLPKAYNLYYLHDAGPNGFFLGHDAIFVKDSASLRPVPGGIDEPLPRVSSHEIGHGFGLEHNPDKSHLMASGTTGTAFDSGEVERARTTAKELGWGLSPEQLHELAEAAFAKNDTAQAKPMYEALAGIPGSSPLKTQAEQRLAALRAKTAEGEN